MSTLSLGEGVCACSARTQRAGGPRGKGEDRAAGSGPALPKPPGHSRNPATASSERLTPECSELHAARQSRPQVVVVPLLVWPGSVRLLARGSPRSPSPAPPRYKARSMCGPRWQKPASADLGPEAVLLSAVAGLGEKAVPFAVESSRTAARVTRHGLKAIERQATSYRYAGMAELADATDLKGGGRCRRPYRSLPPLSKGPPCPIFAKEPRPPYAPQA